MFSELYVQGTFSSDPTHLSTLEHRTDNARSLSAQCHDEQLIPSMPSRAYINQVDVNSRADHVCLHARSQSFNETDINENHRANCSQSEHLKYPQSHSRSPSLYYEDNMVKITSASDVYTLSRNRLYALSEIDQIGFLYVRNLVVISRPYVILPQAISFQSGLDSRSWVLHRCVSQQSSSVNIC